MGQFFTAPVRVQLRVTITLADMSVETAVWIIELILLRIIYLGVLVNK